MINFSLSRKSEKVFPTALKLDGITFPINADFRNVLKILRMLGDDDIPEKYKPVLICKWFYTEAVPADGVNDFIRFAVGVKSSGDSDHDDEPPERQYDYEFDAEEIYASFLREYNIDLFDITFMHWNKFKIMVMNLSTESPFKQKIQLRFKDLAGFKGKALHDLERAKEAVQLPVRYTAEELREMEEFESVWGRF